MHPSERVDAAEAVRAMRPIDDEFFRFVADDAGAMEEIVRAALDDGDIVVESTHHQEVIHVAGSRGIEADAVCRTADGRVVNVEAQVSHENDDVRRVRLHASILTATATPKGARFSEVPDVAVIYLADYDPLTGGRLAYMVRRTVAETGEPFEDGETIVLVNGTVRDGSRLSRVMHVLCDRDALDYGACPRLSERKTFVKSDPEVQKEMADTMQAVMERATEKAARRGYEEGQERGHKAGLEQGLEQGQAAVVRLWAKGAIDDDDLAMSLEALGADDPLGAVAELKASRSGMRP